MRARTSIFLAVCVLGGIGGVAWWTSQEAEIGGWRLETIERRDVRETVSATGALEPVTTVEIGTQVSGTVDELLVDFNDPVEQGQVIARLDPSLLSADVRSARAMLAVRVAERDQAKAEADRSEVLTRGNAVSEQEMLTARTSLAVAEAQVQSARIALRRAERNLGYATVTSPIGGVVIERAVDVGQTVNAGMTAPKLFVIAGDLTHMQIVASVDESDIGRIEAGQMVDFTVQAWPDDHFDGRVRQVRLQSATEENVVTYSVVVDVENPEGLLLPGMTATLDFVVDSVHDVLCVPRAALRFRPSPDQVVGTMPDRGAGRRDGGAVVWSPEGAYGVRATAVSTGLSDAQCTEIRGEGIEEGISVVVGIARPGDERRGGTSPLGTSSNRGRRWRPGGF